MDHTVCLAAATQSGAITGSRIHPCGATPSPGARHTRRGGRRGPRKIKAWHSSQQLRQTSDSIVKNAKQPDSRRAKRTTGLHRSNSVKDSGDIGHRTLSGDVRLDPNVSRIWLETFERTSPGDVRAVGCLPDRLASGHTFPPLDSLRTEAGDVRSEGRQRTSPNVARSGTSPTNVAERRQRRQGPRTSPTSPGDVPNVSRRLSTLPARTASEPAARACREGWRAQG
jgi:hypothetical protein